MSNMYIAWIGFQRRQVSISAYVNMSLRFFPIKKRTSKTRKLVAYVYAAYQSLRSLCAENPQVVWVQVPQTPALWVALIYRRLFQTEAKIIADCHNACFRKPWSNFPLGISSLKKADYVLVHNESQRSVALAHGINPENLVVLEDPPAVFKSSSEANFSFDAPRPWGIFPAGFADDEPVKELFDAARQLPEVSFLVTGNSANLKNRELLENVPANVYLMGFLSREDFDQLVLSCDFILALTKFDGIQLSVCGEAVGAAKPMVVSDTPLLRSLYPAGTEYVRASSDSIAIGVKNIIGRLEEAALEMREFRTRTQTIWRKEKLHPFYSRLRSKTPLIDWTDQ